MLNRLHRSLIAAAALALPASAQEPVDYSTQIRPILNKNCISCHGGVKKSAGVSFLFREEALATGESGLPTVVPGDAEASEMYVRITSDDPNIVMPSPKHGPPLEPSEIELIRRWIDEGAKWGDHWSFEVPERKELPAVEQTDWPKQRIDHFLLANMEDKGWSPNPPADAAIFLRRLNFDLIGLPPTPAEIEEFRSAYERDADEAVAAKTDELLASPHFGEKWASHWLDLARYADSEGLGVDSRRPMFPYRDWVIRAFNEDMPFDHFTKMQLAGDLMPETGLDGQVATAFHRMTQSNGEGGTNDEEFRVTAVMDRIATTWETWQGITFGCVQCHSHPYEPIRHEDYYKFMAFFNNTADRDLNSHHPRVKVPNDHAQYAAANAARETQTRLAEKRIADIAKLREEASWLPVSQMELTSSPTKTEIQRLHGYAEFRTVGTVSKGTTITMTADPGDLDQLTAVRLDIIPLDVENALHTPEMGAVISHIHMALVLPDGSTQPLEIADILGDDPNPPMNDRDSLNKENPRGWGAYSRLFKERNMVAMLAEPVALPDGARVRVTLFQNQFDLAAFPIVSKRGRIALTGDDAFHRWHSDAQTRDERKEYAAARDTLRKLKGISLPVVEELPTDLRRATLFFEGGNWLEKRGEDLAPAVPASLNELEKSGDRASRLDLANWLTSPENPLTARVAVNRVWEQLFGYGIVLTLEDFGSSGILPTHPELLDDLAVRYRDDMQWSTKQLIRELVNSAAYRQDAKTTPDAAAEDAYNLYLARGPRTRLSAEMARDHTLAAAGLITEKLYGPQVYPPMPSGGYTPPRAKGDWKTPAIGDPDRYRRAIYTYVRRSSPFPAFAAFDAPSREVCSKRRIISNTPIAALTTLNDPTSVEAAMAMAQRVDAEHPDDVDAQLSFAFQLATSRAPRPAAAERLRALYDQLVQTYTDKPELAKQLEVSPHIAALNSLCSVVLNLDEAIVK